MPADRTRDGAWWRRAHPEERLGYVAGYLDCLVFDARRSGFAEVSWYNVAPKVTAYYSTESGDVARPVASVLKRIAGAEPRNPLRGHGEEFAGKHGMFDGEYWRQSRIEHRAGFVAGYLECLALERRLEGARFSSPATTYAQLLSEWYGVVVEDPGEIRADRANTKIADALRRFRDR